MNEIINTIKQRRSIRNFESRQISEEELNAIIEAGIYAPSVHNSQPWHFTVIQNPDVINEINAAAKEIMATIEVDWIKKAGINPQFNIAYNAPTLIVVSGKKEDQSWRITCAAAIQNILLAAESLKIGSVWIGFSVYAFKKPGLAQNIGIPDGYEPFHGIALGYKKEGVSIPTPKRNNDVVNYIR